ncbi:iron ABC transporter permease [Haematospirillum sp. 15-248]|uniref:FecCD family ABC transporter permease n=1 Tax=Haematospirillum sp. 15-248 TaxID=2723107 RepID=UPI002AC34A68|nr:iron ABC transporter permease [Haematospirillum sp. 15-248]
MRIIPLSVILTVLLGIVSLISLCIGSTSLPLADVLAGVLGKGDPRITMVIQDIRIPRLLLGLEVGAALGLSGATLQGLLRNPLAEPGLTGISPAAGLGAVVALYHGLSFASGWAVPLFALGAAAVATLVLALLARKGRDGTDLVLGGMAISGVAVALTAVALNLAPNPWAVSEMVLWLMGSLKDRSMDDVLLCTPFILVGSLIALSTGRALDALSLGLETASSLGVKIARLHTLVIIGIAASVGGAVAVTGAIGFVGLVVPHLLRPLVSRKPSHLLLPSALGGALLLVLADCLVRIVPTRQEMMIGVVTALVGTPFFIALVLRYRQGVSQA